jgi:hypothetical protein
MIFFLLVDDSLSTTEVIYCKYWLDYHVGTYKKPLVSSLFLMPFVNTQLVVDLGSLLKQNLCELGWESFGDSVALNVLKYFSITWSKCKRWVEIYNC